eukprot:TRINITY_DN5107_c0_g1_i1.p1 TRINITY_DN5107_c0_g1~~TRINITY_DN5107_c0_g1_i1.p1  ORF type:complete len:398 (-),score=69.34 TRINITY_DN5107_c0_g1_i1:97-1290(-)
MKDLATAYSILSNPEDRCVYDKFGKEGLERREMVRNELTSIKAFSNKIRLAGVAAWVLILVLDYFVGVPLEWLAALVFSLGVIWMAPTVSLAFIAADVVLYFFISTGQLPWLANCFLWTAAIGALNMALLSVDISLVAWTVVIAIEYLRGSYVIGEWYWTASFFAVHTLVTSVGAIIFLVIFFNNFFVLEYPTSKALQVFFRYFSSKSSVLPITLIAFYLPVVVADYFTGLPFEWILAVGHSVVLILLGCFKYSTFINIIKSNTIILICSVIIYYCVPTSILAALTNVAIYVVVLYSLWMDEVASPEKPEPVKEGEATQTVEKEAEQVRVTVDENAPAKPYVSRQLPSFTYLLVFLLFFWIDFFGRERPVHWTALAAFSLATCVNGVLVSEIQHKNI